MIMKNNSFVTLIIITLFSFGYTAQVKAQSNKSVSETIDVKSLDASKSDSQIIETSPHGFILLQESQLPSKTASKKSKPIVSVSNDGQIIGEGEYLNYDRAIIERLISGLIPSDIPKHKIGQSNEQYLEVLIGWAKNNLHLIKPEYHHEIR